MLRSEVPLSQYFLPLLLLSLYSLLLPQSFLISLLDLHDDLSFLLRLLCSFAHSLPLTLEEGNAIEYQLCTLLLGLPLSLSAKVLSLEILSV